MAEQKPTLISRAEARALGLKRYFTGKSCKHGHLCERQVSTGTCIKCANIRTCKYQKTTLKKNYKKSYYLKNKAEIRKKVSAHYESNKERIRAAVSEWKRNNPKKVLAMIHTRRSRKAGGGRHTLKDVLCILEAQKGKCAVCRCFVGKKYQIDHIMPISKGGSNFPSNLQVVCGSCNMRKSSKDPIDFMREVGRLL